MKKAGHQGSDTGYQVPEVLLLPVPEAEPKPEPGPEARVPAEDKDSEAVQPDKEPEALPTGEASAVWEPAGYTGPVPVLLCLHRTRDDL